MFTRQAHSQVHVCHVHQHAAQRIYPTAPNAHAQALNGQLQAVVEVRDHLMRSLDDANASAAKRAEEAKQAAQQAAALKSEVAALSSELEAQRAASASASRRREVLASQVMRAVA